MESVTTIPAWQLNLGMLILDKQGTIYKVIRISRDIDSGLVFYEARAENNKYNIRTVDPYEQINICSRKKVKGEN